MPIEITHSRVILCEGPADKAFFIALIKNRALPEFDIFCPGDVENIGAGVGAYSKFLEAISIPMASRTDSTILITADCDGDPNQSFGKIRHKISLVAHYGYGVPDSPVQLTRSADLPSLVVLMIPWAEEAGCLETLCLEALLASNPNLKKCVEQFTECTKTNAWDIPRRPKMQLQCLISALSEKNPGSGLRQALERTDILIPLQETCFDRIADFLYRFDDFVAQ
jgi:hypothetical protein